MTTERNRRPIPRPGALLLAVAVVVALGQPAVAALKVTVKTHGACTQSSAWTLKVHIVSSASLTATFAVTGAPAGQRWNIFVSDGGSMVLAAKRTTNGSGAFSISRSMTNLAGLDTITVGANTAATGERCSAKAAI